LFKVRDSKGVEHEVRSMKPQDIPDEYIVNVKHSKVEYDEVDDTDWTKEALVGDKPLREISAWTKEKPTIKNTTTKEEEIEISKETWDDWDSKGKYGKFKQKPVVIKEVSANAVAVMGINGGVLKRIGGLNSPGMPDIPDDSTEIKSVVVKGEVEYNDVEVPVWIYRGETAADVANRKKILADLRKAVK